MTILTHTFLSHKLDTVEEKIEQETADQSYQNRKKM